MGIARSERTVRPLKHNGQYGEHVEHRAAGEDSRLPSRGELDPCHVRLTGAAKNTITKLLLDLGEAPSVYQDKAFRNLTCERIQLDEIWFFVGYCKKKKNVDPARHSPDWGDAWTFSALDPDAKLVPSWFVGERTAEDAWELLTDLRGRLASMVQLSTDGHKMYLTAVPEALGDDADYGRSTGARPPTQRTTDIQPGAMP